MAETLMLIDASSSIFRAFYALPPLTNTGGVPTNATLGFVGMLQKVLREEQPDYVVIVWDSPGRKRRKDVYPDYKANRDATPEDLKRQIPYIRRSVEAYGLASLEFEGEEADDVIATLTQQALPRGLEVSIVSTDRDLMQLVSDRVRLLDTYRDRRFGPAEVEARFGVSPERMLDLRSLTGDSSDNIPGVKGIGEKGAAKLLEEWGTLDALLEHAAEVKGKRAREALLAGADEARLSRELSRLRVDLPIELDLERARVPDPDVPALTALFTELEFSRLLEELGVESAVETAPIEIEVVRDLPSAEELAERLGSARRLALACVLEPEEAMLGELIALLLSDAPGRAWLLPVSELGEAGMLLAVRDLLSNEETVWVGHDLKRDWVALQRRGVRLGGALRDVAVAAYVADPAQRVTRPELIVRAYLGRDIPDRESAFGKGARRQPFDAVPLEALGAQIGAETAAALDLDEKIVERLDALGQRELYEEIEVPLVAVLARMEVAGVRIDEDLLRDLAREIESDLGSLERTIYGLAGEEFKINSPKQLQRILFEKLALPPTKRTKTGFSTDESVLEELALNYELPREILSWRRLAKLLSTYVEALPRLVHPETGRIHCSFNQTVAATGRLSASNPNLQNIPVRTPAGQRIREAFIPAAGRVLFSADYSQIELRILAHLCGDEALVEAFRTGDDIHVRTASMVFEVPPEEVTPEQRSHMKGINFGIIYGSSAFGIARQLGVSQNVAREHIRAYFERYPGVRGYLDDAVRRARELGYSETLFGRRRYLPDLRSRNRVLRSAAERMAVNSAIQGTAADIIKKAMVEIDEQLDREEAPEAQMILQVHDELVFEVAPADVDPLEELVVGHMKGVAELSVPVEVHTGQGRSWREAH